MSQYSKEQFREWRRTPAGRVYNRRRSEQRKQNSNLGRMATAYRRAWGMGLDGWSALVYVLRA